MNTTPDFVFQQAYTATLHADVNRRIIPRPAGEEYGIAWETSSFHENLKLPRHKETLVMTFQGKLVRAKIHKMTDQQHQNHKRGRIVDFSAQSRGRLFDIFNSMEIRKAVIFITLTYLSEDIDCDLAKAQLRAFIKRLQRLHDGKNLSFIWRMEFQERGAIHFHIMAFGLPFTPKQDIQTMWGEIICQVAPFTRIEMIYSSKKVMNYVAKYIAKVNTSENSGFNPVTYLSAYQAMHGDEIGRVWGIIGKSNLPMAELVTIEIGFNYARFMQFKELASHTYPPIMESLSLGFRLYVMSAQQWKQWFYSMYVLPDYPTTLDITQK
jgi:hypothetical protein